ncbi:MAG: hypothetical protein EXX96DRAFT_453519, partial [Benjaminiella poitrasii]
VWSVDPGLKDLYIGSDGSSNNRHRIRKTSQNEYYGICGYNSATKRRKAYAEQYVDIVNIINRMSTLNTINPRSYFEPNRFILVDYNTIMDYFSLQKFPKSMWKANISKQEGLHEVAKRLLSGSTKY